MSKKFYIKDENGMHFSEDKKTRYTLLEGQALHDFLKTEQGKMCCFYIQTDDNGDQVGFETTREAMQKRQAELQRMNYKTKCEQKDNITVLSLNTPVGDCEESELIDVIPDETVSIEDELIHNETIKTLHKALRKLTVEEYELLYCLFLKDEPLTEREYAKIAGLPQQTVNYRKNRVLKKIKNFF